MKQLEGLQRVLRSWMIMLPLVALAACGPGQDAGTMQSRVDGALNDLRRDRNALRSELMLLRRDIDRYILDTEEALRQDDLPMEERSDRQLLLQELVDQRNRVQQALQEVERSDEQSWSEVRERSKNTSREADKWFERRAEKEDLRKRHLS
jgi:hypothetical protein